MPRALVLPLVLMSASWAWAQTHVVQLDIVATDAKGDPASDLTANDIQVKEDGKARPVVFFRPERSKGPAAMATPGEFVNTPSPPPMLVLLDRWNERLLTSAMSSQDLNKALNGMESVEHVYIYFLTNHGELYPVRPLPGPETDLRSTAAPTAAELISRLNDASKTFSGMRDMANIDIVQRVDATLRALTVLAQFGGLPGPKSFIWVTHGFPLVGANLSNQLVDFTPAIHRAAEAAVRDRIAYYVADDSEQGAGADVLGEGKQTLELFATLTGGRWYSSGRTDMAIAGAAADARGTYRMAYSSGSAAGKTPKLRIDSARKGVRLLLRANPGGEDPALLAEDAFASVSHSPFDATEIGLRATLARKPGQIVHLDIRANTSDVFLDHRPDGYHGNLVLKFAFYSKGVFQVPGPSFEQDLVWTQEHYDAVAKDGIPISQDVPVPDRFDEIRAVVFDRAMQGLGSVTIPLK